MSTDTKERRLRYALRKDGFSLHKSRAIYWSYANQLGYMIVNTRYNFLVAGPNYELTLEDVEDFVKDQCEED